MPTLSVGESIEVEGRWVTHKTYGSQFEVNKFMPVTPSSLEGIYAYLSSGMIHGIGEKMATRIIDKVWSRYSRRNPKHSRAIKRS